MMGIRKQAAKTLESIFPETTSNLSSFRKDLRAYGFLYALANDFSTAAARWEYRFTMTQEDRKHWHAILYPRVPEGQIPLYARWL